MPAHVPETQAYYVCFRQIAEEERKIVGFRSRQPMVSADLKSFINSPFFCSKFQSGIVKIIHSALEMSERTPPSPPPSEKTNFTYD